MKKSILILMFGLFANLVNAQYVELAKTVLGSLSDQNQEMVAYLRQIDSKMQSMENREKQSEMRKKASPNPLLINTKVAELEKKKSDVINIAKVLVSGIKAIKQKKKISNADQAINAILDISSFTVQSYLVTKKLMTYSAEAIETQDKLKVLADTSALVEQNKKQLLFINEQLKDVK
ncbi:hypothetical protein EG359_22500 (plasmid) [Chryseobacterium joostei]|uniref:Uncharacterized protein n=1 Tax=Chryseobacterium joostei TaxID=112234 RepID=A0A1N7KGD7_9FLAO|nr:hypothetical protein [Chryseobacterium joostei]AZB02432.1 hypothetical protein EG359_22500 [Chryseobacterium joostei]SIS60534.1 hypothetical protein SAMN05421768_11211 [Chryseobacterium joostei]